jgi:hypothetical protein
MSKNIKRNKKARKAQPKRGSGSMVLAASGRNITGFDPTQRGPYGGVSASKMWYGSPDTYYRIEKYVDKKNDIKDGILFKWRGPIFVAQTVVSLGATTEWGTMNTLASNSQVSANSPVALAISPMQVLPRGSPGNVASVYNKFMFKKLSFDWVGSCATTGNAGIIMGYNPDGAAQSGDLDTISEIVSQPYNSFWPLWARTKADVSDLLNIKELYYSDGDTATDASLRQSYQGFASFLPNASIAAFTTAILYGALYSEGELVLCECQTFAQNYAALPPLGADAPKARTSVIRRIIDGQKQVRAQPALVAPPQHLVEDDEDSLRVPVRRRDERKEKKASSDREKSV